MAKGIKETTDNPPIPAQVSSSWSSWEKEENEQGGGSESFKFISRSHFSVFILLADSDLNSESYLDPNFTKVYGLALG